MTTQFCAKRQQSATKELLHLVGRKIELLMIVTTVRCCRRSSRQRRWRKERLWMIVDCGCEVPPTDTTTNTNTNLDDKDDDRRAYIYIIIVQRNVNSMHNSSRHQQFKLPSPAGGRASTWGCKRRLTFSISPHRTKCTNQQRYGTTDTILSYKIIGPYAYTYYYKIYIVL